MVVIRWREQKSIKKIYLTALASFKPTLDKIKNIKPKYALKHPNWKMGKKFIEPQHIIKYLSNRSNKIFNLHQIK